LLLAQLQEETPRHPVLGVLCENMPRVLSGPVVMTELVLDAGEVGQGERIVRAELQGTLEYRSRVFKPTESY
jgi:hypothetical protein